MRQDDEDSLKSVLPDAVTIEQIINDIRDVDDKISLQQSILGALGMSIYQMCICYTATPSIVHKYDGMERQRMSLSLYHSLTIMIQPIRCILF